MTATNICHASRTVRCQQCNSAVPLRGDAEQMLIAAEQFARTHQCKAQTRHNPRRKQSPVQVLSRWQPLFAHIKI